MLQNSYQSPPVLHSPWISRLLEAYYRGPGHPAKFRVLNYLEGALGHKRILVKSRYGFVMAVDSRDLVQRHVLSLGEYEPEISRLLRNTLQADDVYIDIGANVGYHACLALRCGARRVICFEPDPLNCQIMSFNFALNKFQSYDIFKYALDAQDGERVFYRAPINNVGKSGLTKIDGSVPFNVRTASLTLVAKKHVFPRATVIKIDVEGWELAVLRGAAEFLKETQPRQIIFESSLQAGGPDPEVKHLLNELGYRLAHIPRDDGSIQEAENFVALRNGDSSLERLIG